MLFKRTLAVCVLTAAAATVANATDVPPLVVPPPQTVAPPPAPAFSWAGPYVGAYGGYLFGPGLIQGGVQAGYNFAFGNFIAGAEAQAGAVFTGGGVGFEGNVNGRLGAVLADTFLAYGEAGVGVITPGAFTYTAGGGVEVAVGPAMSLFAETKLFGTFGGGCCGVTVQGGVNWHPGF